MSTERSRRCTRLHVTLSLTFACATNSKRWLQSSSKFAILNLRRRCRQCRLRRIFVVCPCMYWKGTHLRQQQRLGCRTSALPAGQQHQRRRRGASRTCNDASSNPPGGSGDLSRTEQSFALVAECTERANNAARAFIVQPIRAAAVVAALLAAALTAAVGHTKRDSVVCCAVTHSHSTGLSSCAAERPRSSPRSATTQFGTWCSSAFH